MTWRKKSFLNVIIVKQILLTVVEYLIRLFQSFVLLTLVDQRLSQLVKVSKNVISDLNVCVHIYIPSIFEKNITLNNTRKGEV